jgi:hypothetical protein
MHVQVDESLFADLIREMTARGYADDVTRQGGVVWLHCLFSERSVTAHGVRLLRLEK